ncbi:CdaR family transcriptional regulator [Zafaria sp. Z1313]|uniref:CdaR family transcriptional regulator n=1 Tax=Zafaria sp. Z1313 TaxID=3423202 RepID=UPI003D303459
MSAGAPALDAALAQRIVDHVAPSLEQNVNIMDPTGLIVASREPGRVGRLHHAARRAARTGEAVAVHPGEARGGEQPGVNVPLVFDGGLLGVVGITGEPARVGPLADLLVLAIGLLLAREREADDAARREALDRELLSRLVTAPTDPEAAAAALAAVHPRLAAPWFLAAVLEAPDRMEGHEAASPGSRAAATPGPPRQAGAISRALAPTGRFRTAVFLGALWVLGSATDADRALLCRTAGAHGGLVLLGDPCPDAATLGGSAKALGALCARPAVLPQADGTPPNVLHLRHLTAELAVAALDPEAARHLAARCEPLGRQHLETLAAYLECGGSASGAARALFAHRNTVLQRLERITTLTGLDPRDPREALTLRLALAAARDGTPEPS